MDWAYYSKKPKCFKREQRNKKQAQIKQGKQIWKAKGPFNSKPIIAMPSLNINTRPNQPATSVTPPFSAPAGVQGVFSN